MRVQGAWVIGIAVAAAAVAAAAALAVDLGGAGGIEYRGSVREVDAPQIPKAAAKCPSDKHVSGNGVVIFDPQSTDTFDHSASLPVDGGDSDHAPDDGWKIRGIAAIRTTRAASTAICADGETRYVKDSEAVAPGYPVLEADCASGYHVTGGGASVEPVSSHVVWGHPFDGGDGDARPDDGWRTKLYVDALDQEPKVFAVCRRDEPKYRREHVTVDPGTGTTVQAQCSASSHLVGAAGSLTGESSPSGIARVVIRDDPDDPGHAPDDIVDTFGEVGVGAPADDLTAWAICAK